MVLLCGIISLASSQTADPVQKYREQIKREHTVQTKLRTELTEARRAGASFDSFDVERATRLASAVTGFPAWQGLSLSRCEAGLWPYAFNRQALPAGTNTHSQGPYGILWNPQQKHSSTYHTTRIGKMFPNDRMNPWIAAFVMAEIWDRSDLNSPLGDRKGSFVEWRDRCIPDGSGP